ncbi:hypothetical protein D3C76_427190 [compost metagenome]
MQPRALQAQIQFTVVDAGLHVIRVEAEQPQEADEVGGEERNPLEELQFLQAVGQTGEHLDLLANLRQVGTQVLAIATAELPLHLGVGVVVQHRLHHAQLVEVGVQQVLHDSLGECAVRHARLFRVDKTSVYGIAVDCDGERSIKNPAVAGFSPVMRTQRHCAPLPCERPNISNSRLLSGRAACSDCTRTGACEVAAPWPVLITESEGSCQAAAASVATPSAPTSSKPRVISSFMCATL